MAGTEMLDTSTIPCNICGSKHARPLFSVQEKRLAKCCGCGLVRTTPWEEEEPLYQDESYFSRRNAYIDRLDEFERIFANLLTQVERRKRKGRLLDVGCGPGLLLNVARQRGWDVHGLEISEWAARYACEELGLPVVCGGIDEQPFPDGNFDVIIANHSIEHMPDPCTALGIMHRMLAADGMLVVGVPNFGSLMAMIRGPQWPSLLPEQHRWHFTPKTMRLLLSKAGFDILSISYDNHDYWAGHAHVLKRLGAVVIGWLSLRLGRGEAMLVFAAKR